MRKKRTVSLRLKSASASTSSTSGSMREIDQIFNKLLNRSICLLMPMLFYGNLISYICVLDIVLQLGNGPGSGNRLLVSAVEHRSTSSFRRSQQQALYKAPCLTQTDCRFENTQCNLASKKCQCKTDYVQVDSFVNRSYITHLAMTCLPIARLDERCISDLQCIVDYSECKLITDSNRTAHLCKCSLGHELKDDQATVILDGLSYRVRPMCDPERSNSSSWLFTVIFISILVLFIMITTFVLIVRYQRLRQPYNQSTITSLTAQAGLNSNPMGHHPLGSSSPPPMGSAEAEFQNDFIQVFPMHHLEPMPDKNAHAFIIK